MKLKLTTASIRAHCKPPAPGATSSTGKPVLQLSYWDEEMPGFGIVVRERSATFVFQRQLGMRTVKVTIGRFGTWTPENARKRAREIAVEMDKGKNPNEERRKERGNQVTLAQALAMHLDDMRASDCSPRSIEMMEDEVGRFFADWLGKSLASITGDECRGRHRRITADSGPYAANRALRQFRACYYTAARVHPAALPQRSPTLAVRYNKEDTRKGETARIAWEDLPAWWAQVAAIENPVRRDLQWFLLVTGLRATDGSTVRWEHVDFKAGTIYRPKPKGGTDRAFTVPVAAWTLELLRRRQEENKMRFPDGDGGWAFPSRNGDGEVAPVRSPRIQKYEKGTKMDAMPSPHRLRHTFASACHEAYLREIDLKILMNHTLPAQDKNVTHGYVHASLGHLRGCVEKVTKFLLKKAGVDAGSGDQKRRVG